MIRSEKIYTGLCILFVSLIMLGNLTYQKFIGLQIPFHKFEVSAGAVLYPLTFLITDVITELYGKEKATFCIRIATLINILMTIIIAFMDYLPATSWSTLNDETFHKIFGSYSIVFVSSLMSCYISQAIDVHLYLWIRKLTKGKYLWLRSNGSTCFSLLIDTTVVMGLMTLWGIFPSEHMWLLIVNSYSWKLFFTLCSTPLFYISLTVIKHFSEVSSVPTHRLYNR